MKVALCYPALLPGSKPNYGLQPLGVLGLAAMLRLRGFEADVIDAEIDGLTIEATVRRILDGRPDLVGLSLMTPQLQSALAIAAAVKRQRPGLGVVLGGAHVDSTRDDVFQMSDAVDLAVHGEGEETLSEICGRLQDAGGALARAGVAGLANVISRTPAGSVRVNPPRPFVADLDALPPPDYDAIDVSRYRVPTIGGRFVIGMMLSRGCAYRCTFCDAPHVMGRRPRHVSVARAIRDIRSCVDRYGCRTFAFKDSTFTANREWATAFCQALIDAGLDIRWRCATRASAVTPELLALMARAGCVVINVGVESGDPAVLERIRKQVPLEAVVAMHEQCRRLGIRTYATFLVGSPGETPESMAKTIAFARRIRPNLAMFFVATAYPGTRMYEEAVAAGTITPRWWTTQAWDPDAHSAFQFRWGTTATGALVQPGFDAELWQRRATRAFYLRPGFAWDTAAYCLRHPGFVWHLWVLGREVLPFYRLGTLLPKWFTPRERDRRDALVRCPGDPTVRHPGPPECP